MLESDLVLKQTVERTIEPEKVLDWVSGGPSLERRWLGVLKLIQEVIQAYTSQSPNTIYEDDWSNLEPHPNVEDLTDSDSDFQSVFAGRDRATGRIIAGVMSGRESEPSILPPTWTDTNSKAVLSQVHAYMDQHKCTYGYIVTHDAIFLLRSTLRELHTSPAIKHDAQVDLSQGIWNSRIALLYLSLLSLKNELNDDS